MAPELPKFVSEPAKTGEPPILISIPTMIASAEAVALVCIHKVVEVKVPEFDDGHAPNHLAIVRVHDSYRGSFPEQFEVGIKVSRYINPSAQKGQMALFFKKTVRSDDPPVQEYNRYGWQGFKVVSDLVRPSDPPKGKKALAAVRKAVIAYKPMLQKSIWRPKLNDAALEPFLELLSDTSPAIRAWAIHPGLSGAEITPRLGQNLLSALQDKDPLVRSNSAFRLTRDRYSSAKEALKRYLGTLPASEGPIRMMLLMYLLEDPLRTHLEKLDTKFVRRDKPVRIRVSVGGGKIVEASRIDPAIWKHLRAFTPQPDVRGTFTILLSIQNEKLQADVKGQF